jgi:spermidine synthase
MVLCTILRFYLSLQALSLLRSHKHYIDVYQQMVLFTQSSTGQYNDCTIGFDGCAAKVARNDVDSHWCFRGMPNEMNSSIEIRESRGVRTLHFGSEWVQGAMRISRPWDLELAYTREMMSALLLSAGWPELPKRILQIGLGAGSLSRFIDRYLPDAEQVVIEQSATVVAAARQAFNLPAENERLQIIVAEGADWLANATEAFDLILVDGFDADGQTGDLESLGFYRDCRQRLTPGGLLVCNFLSRGPKFLQSCLALDSAFDGRTRLLPQTPGGNVIALAAVNKTVNLDEATLRERVRILHSRTGLDLEPLALRLIDQEDGLPFGL